MFQRIRRRRSPRANGERRRRERPRERDSQLARSLERIHRKRRPERDRLSDAELKRTYTGLDRSALSFNYYYNPTEEHRML